MFELVAVAKVPQIDSKQLKSIYEINIKSTSIRGFQPSSESPSAVGRLETLLHTARRSAHAAHGDAAIVRVQEVQRQVLDLFGEGGGEHHRLTARARLRHAVALDDLSNLRLKASKTPQRALLTSSRSPCPACGPPRRGPGTSPMPKEHAHHLLIGRLH